MPLQHILLLQATVRPPAGQRKVLQADARVLLGFLVRGQQPRLLRFLPPPHGAAPSSSRATRSGAPPAPARSSPAGVPSHGHSDPVSPSMPAVTCPHRMAVL